MEKAQDTIPDDCWRNCIGYTENLSLQHAADENIRVHQGHHPTVEIQVSSPYDDSSDDQLSGREEKGSEDRSEARF